MTNAQKKARANYKASEKGRKANRKWHLSDAGRAANKKYTQSEKGKIVRDKYKKSDKGFAVRIRYQNSLHGKMAQLLSSARSRANRTGLPFDLTVDYLIHRFTAINGRCEATGVKFEFLVRGGRRKNHRGPSLDQKLPGQGYTKENVQIVSVWFNHMKGDMTNEEAMAILNEWKNHDC